jgi:flagellar basal-body rod protein FlgB
VLAENVANSDTPGYHARDLAPLKFEDPPLAARPTTVAALSLTRTDDGHMPGVGMSQSAYRTGTTRVFDVRPTGNAVNLEGEMSEALAVASGVAMFAPFRRRTVSGRH